VGRSKTAGPILKRRPTTKKAQGDGRLKKRTNPWGVFGETSARQGPKEGWGGGWVEAAANEGHISVNKRRRNGRMV